MTLRTKIYGGYIIGLLFCIIAIAYLLYHTERRDAILESVSNIDFGKDQHMDLVRENLTRIEKSAMVLNFIPDRNVILQESGQIEASTTTINDRLDSLNGLVRINQSELNPTILNPSTVFFVRTAAVFGITDLKYFEPIPYEKEIQYLDKMKHWTNRLSLNTEKEKQYGLQKDRARTHQILKEEIDPLIDSLRLALDNLENTSERHALAKTEILSRLSVINRILTYAVLAFLFLLILSAILDVRKILRSVNLITAATQTVGSGKFDQQVDLQSFVELNTLGNAFNRMIRQLEEIEKLKSDFFNKLVHDFKSPLDNIKQSSAILSKNMSGAELTSDQKKFIDIIQRSATDLRTMVQDQLEESKLVAGQSSINYQWTDLKELLKERIQLQRPIATSKNINFSVKFTDSDFHVHCDPLKIQRVIDNLSSNAIKFSPKNSTISIELEDRDDIIQIRIKDSGPGIPLDLQPQIFQKYVRQVSSDTASGTGLGLYTAKYIIELHKGRIWFKSKPGFGTTFYFSLPKQKQMC